MSDELFVPADFAVPDGLTAGEFRLAPLGPQHNDADYAAWTASMDHTRATPGFPDGSTPTAPRSTRSCTTWSARG